MEQQRFRDRLLALKAELISAEETGSTAEATVELDQARLGRLTRMDALQGQAMSQATGQRRRALLRDIDAALTRCNDGCFGDCLECGEDIDPRRLEASPATTLCIACAEQRERH